MTPAVSQMIGKRFGKYIVISFVGRKYNSAIMLNCQCDCGSEKIIRKTTLVAKNGPRQCLQCSAVERNKKRAKHNMINTTTYNIWRSMIRRCIDPKKRCYHRYGGRGITVCERWRDFRNFFYGS